MNNPIEISGKEISQLAKDDFRRVMNLLIRAEAQHLHLSLRDDVETSERNDDNDEGVDARVRAGNRQSEWFEPGLSVWQFKAGKALTKAEIAKEIKKPGVRHALDIGATYYLAIAADLC
jgi:hypothetical protein